MAVFPVVRHISVSIDRPPAEVYAFAVEPRNLPRWAEGLSSSTVEEVDGALVSDSPMGRVTFRFAERNAFGVLDHDVTLESGQTFHNSMRVIGNADGSEVVFTFFRRPGASDEDFEADAAMVQRDLESLARLVEAGPS